MPRSLLPVVISWRLLSLVYIWVLTIYGRKSLKAASKMLIREAEMKVSRCQQGRNLWIITLTFLTNFPFFSSPEQLNTSLSNSLTGDFTNWHTHCHMYLPPHPRPPNKNQHRKIFAQTTHPRNEHLFNFYFAPLPLGSLYYRELL